MCVVLSVCHISLYNEYRSEGRKADRIVTHRIMQSIAIFFY